MGHEKSNKLLKYLKINKLYGPHPVNKGLDFVQKIQDVRKNSTFSDSGSFTSPTTRQHSWQEPCNFNERPPLDLVQMEVQMQLNQPNSEKSEKNKLRTDQRGKSKPEQELSFSGHINSLGGEMRTWAPLGALLGALVGMLVGIAIYFAVVAGTITLPGLENLQRDFPVLFFVTCTWIFTAAIAGAGALIGFGTPRFNPRPEQGWVRRWETIFFWLGDKEKKAYFPVLKRRAPRNRVPHERTT